MKNINIQGYFETVQAPWGQLFYRLAWHNTECKGKRILDFGSGFGITADHFAADNEVTALEPNEEMLEYRACWNQYRQLAGGVECLSMLPGGSFDMVICHNVLEYVDDRKQVLSELARLLKPDGILSLIKHNKAGKIMQKAVFEYKVEEAIRLLDQGKAVSANFGTIEEYGTADLEEYAEGLLKIDKIYGLRMFYALQRNELKNGGEWMENMYQLECRAEEIPEFRDIAFFHHVILRPNSYIH